MDQNRNPELKEKNFIREEKKRQNPFPLWLWLLLIIGILAIIASFVNGMVQKTSENVEKSPYLQVTNRQLSLFLWQNPEYMRSNQKQKSGYLPRFELQTNIPKAEGADEYAAVPPEVLFHYHTWKRLLSDYKFPRPIPLDEFEEFLTKDPEWAPQNWKEAPQNYIDLISKIDTIIPPEWEKSYAAALPEEVKAAFTGWKNYFKEGKAINALRPTTEEIDAFLKEYPNYARNYWRNLYPEYLKSMQEGKENLVPEELTSFLRVAFYNYRAAERKI